MTAQHMNRREFAGATTAGIAGGALGLATGARAAEQTVAWDPVRRPVVTGKPLRVQPVLMHTVYQRREATSWRSWGSINTPQAAAEELGRIAGELQKLAAEADFPLELLKPIKVSSVSECRNIHQADYDVVMLYPATGRGDMLKACFPEKPDKDTLIFARHASGPTYYWYEALSTRYLKPDRPETWRSCARQDFSV